MNLQLAAHKAFSDVVRIFSPLHFTFFTWACLDIGNLNFGRPVSQDVHSQRIFPRLSVIKIFFSDCSEYMAIIRINSALIPMQNVVL
jgi:hypothetical protein